MKLPTAEAQRSATTQKHRNSTELRSAWGVQSNLVGSLCWDAMKRSRLADVTVQMNHSDAGCGIAFSGQHVGYASKTLDLSQ